MTTQYTPNFGLAQPDFRQGPWHDLLNGDIGKIDALLFSALSAAATVVWTNSTAFAAGVNAIDQATATTWVCVVAHTSPAAPTTFAQDRTNNPGRWTQIISGFAPRGEWAHNTQYYPYDLAYQSSLGIFAQCKTKHISNAAGSIKDDAAFWFFIYDMSTVTLTTAIAVSYDPTASGLAVTNVQAAIDKIETQVVAINNINVTQGNNIGTNTTDISNRVAYTTESRTNAEKLIAVGNIGAVSASGGQTLTGGFGITPNNIGNFTSPFTPNPLLGNYQYGTNNSAFTMNAPTIDCAIDILITNTGGAGAIAFTGYTIAVSNTGDPLLTTSGYKFILSIRRINGISTYLVKALQ